MLDAALCCKYWIFLLQVSYVHLESRPQTRQETRSCYPSSKWMNTTWVHAYALHTVLCYVPWKKWDVLMQPAGHLCRERIDRAYPFHQSQRVSSGAYRLSLVVHIMSSFATGNDENSSPQTSDPNCTTNNGSYNFIEKALECPLCLSLICEPLSISCGHSFCRVCLVKSLRRLALMYARLHGWKLRSRTEIQP